MAACRRICLWSRLHRRHRITFVFCSACLSLRRWQDCTAMHHFVDFSLVNAATVAYWLYNGWLIQQLLRSGIATIYWDNWRQLYFAFARVRALISVPIMPPYSVTKTHQCDGQMILVKSATCYSGLKLCTSQNGSNIVMKLLLAVDLCTMLKIPFQLKGLI